MNVISNSKNTLNIVDALDQSDYTNNKELITSIVFEYFSAQDNKTGVYLTHKVNDSTNKLEKIIVAKYSISITLKEITYEVPILIYFPKDFPHQAPDVYVERNEEIGVN